MSVSEPFVIICAQAFIRLFMLPFILPFFLLFLFLLFSVAVVASSIKMKTTRMGLRMDNPACPRMCVCVQMLRCGCAILKKPVYNIYFSSTACIRNDR